LSLCFPLGLLRGFCVLFGCCPVCFDDMILDVVYSPPRRV
jgi:hypothetical protein